MRFLFIKFGNHADDEKRLAAGGGEAYYGKRYTMDYFTGLAKSGSRVLVLAVDADAPFVMLPSGVESVGVRLYPGRHRRPRFREVIRVAESWAPTHLILMVAAYRFVRWSVRRRLETLALFAESFHGRGLRRRLEYWRLARALNDPAIRWVANHGPNAAADLVRIGVDPHKVVPYDWPAFASPASFSPKSAPGDPRRVELVYVGLLLESKGVGDILDAVALAHRAGEDWRVTLVGDGDRGHFERKVQKLGLAGAVTFTGRIAHKRVLETMHRGDVVVVPSRHEYPEGMPMTVYEGLCSRTPVAISDHPMFRGRIDPGRTGVIFRASDPGALLEAVRGLVRDPELYARLSLAADAACATYLGPFKWDRVITRWREATPEADADLRAHTLAEVEAAPGRTAMS